jgi:membrane protease subunit HflK
MTAVQEATGQEPPAGASLNPAVDGYVITADANIVHLSAILSYRIEDPVQCVFSFARGTNSTLDLSGVSYNVQNALNNALVQTAARFNVDDILTRDRLGFQDAVRKRVIKLVDDQKLGVVIESCPVTPRVPRQTDDAFRKVTTAIQSRATAIDNARSYTNQILSRAAADASAMTNIAVVEAARTVAEAKADAIQFAALLPRWKQNRDLFVQQKLVESMGRALTNVADKAYMPSALNNAPTQLRIDLNREAPKPKQAPPTQ